MELVERRMSEHEDILSMAVAGTTQIGVIEQRAGRFVVGGRVFGLTGEKGRHALAVEDAEFERARRDGFEASGVETAVRAQNPEARAKPPFGMPPAGEHGADQALGIGPISPARRSTRAPGPPNPARPGDVDRSPPRRARTAVVPKPRRRHRPPAAMSIPPPPPVSNRPGSSSAPRPPAAPSRAR